MIGYYISVVMPKLVRNQLRADENNAEYDSRSGDNKI